MQDQVVKTQWHIVYNIHKKTRMKIGILLLLICTISCTSVKKATIPAWMPYDETGELAKNAGNENTRLRYKLIQSKILDKNELWKNIAPQIKGFTEQDYEGLKPLILEQDIPTLQAHITSGKLSYEKLTQWYLFRMVKFENDKTKLP